MPLDFTFRIYLMTLLDELLVMPLRLIRWRHHLDDIFIFLERLVWSTFLWMMLQCRRLTSLPQRAFSVGHWKTTLWSIAFDSRCSARASLLAGRCFNAIINLVFTEDGDRLIVADIAFKTFEFRVVTVYASNIVGEWRSFFRRLVLMGD